MAFLPAHACDVAHGCGRVDQDCAGATRPLRSCDDSKFVCSRSSRLAKTRRGAGLGSFVLNCSQVGRRREKRANQLIEKSGDVRSWWARQDLNLGPTDYESAALTAELRAPVAHLIGLPTAGKDQNVFAALSAWKTDTPSPSETFHQASAPWSGIQDDLANPGNAAFPGTPRHFFRSSLLACR